MFGCFKITLCVLTLTVSTVLGAQPANSDTPTAAEHKAAIDSIMKIIQEGKDVNARDSKGQTALFLACLADQPQLVKKILDAGGKQDIANNKGNLPLHAAAANGNTEIASLLVGTGADINAAGDNGKSPLYWATLNNQLDMVRYLLKMGANPTQPKTGGWYPIHAAAGGGRIDILKAFLEHGVSADIQNLQNGFTPLCDAANSQQLEACQCLIENGADVNLLSYYHWSPLMYATGKGNADIVQLLLASGANTNEFGNGGKNPLLLAIENKQPVIVKILLEKGADTTVMDEKGKTVLDYAAKNNHKAMINLLVQNGVDINMVNGEGNTCFYHQTIDYYNGNLDLLTPLIQLGADPSTPCVLSLIDTLYYKKRSGEDQFVEQLRKIGVIADPYRIAPPDFVPTQYVTKDTWGGPEVKFDTAFESFLKSYAEQNDDWQFTDEAGNTFLHWVAENDKPNWVEWAIEKGIDVDVASKFGKTPLHRAAKFGKTAAMRVLIEYKADINAEDALGNTPLHLAMFKGQTKAIEMLLTQKASINATNHYGMTPLHYFDCGGTRQARLIQTLLASEADPTIQDFKGETVLHLAARESDSFPEVLQDIIRKGGDVNQPNKMGEYPLHLAYNSPKLTTILIQQKADTEARTRKGYTPLTYAIMKGKMETVKVLVENGADVNARTYGGLTPLHFATWDGKTEMMSLLVENGADLTLKGYNNKTVMDMAKEGKQLAAAKRLKQLQKEAAKNMTPAAQKELEQEANDIDEQKIASEKQLQQQQEKKRENAMHRSDWTYHCQGKPLALAMLKSDANAVKQAVDNGADLNEYFVVNGSFHYTALYMAVCLEDEPMIRRLVELGADINLGEKEPTLQSPLHRAAWDRSLPMTKLLVELGADMNLENSNGDPAFFVAAMKGNRPLVQYYKEAGFGLSFLDRSGKSILHRSVQWSSTVSFLLEMGMDPNLRTKGGTTPLLSYMSTAGTDNAAVPKLLVKYGADVNLANGEYTPLCQALARGKLVTAKFLVEQGADVNAGQNGQTRTGPAIHLCKGNLEMVQLLIEAGADVNSKDKRGRNVIHNMMKSSGGIDDIATLDFFLEKGVDLNAKDNGQKAPIFLCIENERIDLLEALIEREADIEATDSRGQTPLWYAAATKKSRIIVQTLIKHGAQTEITNKSGTTLNDQLKNWKQSDMLELIENATR
ncbi:MAG: ankyrin repeat domain-containing protein [Planctomycetota bacterium]|jgi:ankyrin repeat protein